MNRIVMSFYNQKSEENIVIVDECFHDGILFDDKIYIMNKSTCTATKYDCEFELLDMLKSINFEKEITMNYEDISRIRHFILSYANEIDGKVMYDFMNVITQKETEYRELLEAKDKDY